MKKFALAIALTALAAQATLAMPILTYTPASGNLSFDLGADTVASMRLFSAGGNLIPNAGNDVGYPLTEQTATLYSWLDFGGGQSGVLDIGDIVTPGTDVSDLTFDYTFGVGTETLFDAQFVVAGGGITPTPAAGSTIDLGQLVSNPGLGAVTFDGGNPTAASFSGESNAGALVATINGNAIDITANRSVTDLLAAGTAISGTLDVEGDGGPFSFTVNATVPEPATLTLFGLALAGVAVARRK